MTRFSNLEALRCHVNPWSSVYLRSTHITFKADFIFSTNKPYDLEELYNILQKPLEHYYFVLSRKIMIQIPDQDAEHANALISVFPTTRTDRVKSYNIETRMPDEDFAIKGLIAVPRFNWFKTQSDGYWHAMSEIRASIKASTTGSLGADCILTDIGLERITRGMNSAPDIILRELAINDLKNSSVFTLL